MEFHLGTLTDQDGETIADASCRGWSRPRTTHRRRFEVEPGAATIEDQVIGPCRSVRFFLPLDPAWQVEFEDGSLSARLTRPATHDQPALRDEFRWRLESEPYYPGFGREIERSALIGEGAAVESSTLRISLGR